MPLSHSLLVDGRKNGDRIGHAADASNGVSKTDLFEHVEPLQGAVHLCRRQGEDDLIIRHLPQGPLSITGNRQRGLPAGVRHPHDLAWQ